ncbi:type I restriction endonuclease, partial [Francisella tularensis]|uniref:type I restriction endonuclease n=1 Tax=Francisella tularensis TaxID=263 RepID=UPI002381A743
VYMMEFLFDILTFLLISFSTNFFRINYNKRPDLIIFVNGLQLVVIELKNATDENATIKSDFDQIRTYKATIPSLFRYNYICVIIDGL